MVTLRHVTRLPRMRAGLAIALVGVIAVAGNAVAQSAAEPVSSSDPQAGVGAPTVAAEARDLQSTTTATGQLERTDERTIGYGGTVTAVPTDHGDASEAENGASETAANNTVALDDAEIALASAQVASGPTDEPTCDPDQAEKLSAEKTTPCEPEEPSEEPSEPEEPSEEPSEPEEPSEEPTPEPSPTPSEPGQPSEPGPRPEPTPTEPFIPPAPGGVPGVQQPTKPGASQQQVMPGGQRAGAVGPAAQGSEPTADGQTGVAPLVEPAVLTSIADLGAEAKRGAILYEADAEPVVALIGAIPIWRTLEVGVDNGADVRQLEKNLDALGYGDDLTIDREFTDATADAVEAWEDDLGHEDPDGIVEPGDVTYLTDTGTIIAQEAAVGETLSSGTPVLTISGASEIVSADVPVDQIDAWPRSAEVALVWDDGDATTGAVTSIGRDITTSEDVSTIEVTIALDMPERNRPNQSQVTASLTVDSRPGAIAVPVTAIVAGSNGQPAVRVVEGGRDRVVEVTTGLVDGGWVQVLDGISPGDVVRLPG
jgi:Putative peptidoglycan binding domain/HlyD family secretion protein